MVPSVPPNAADRLVALRAKLGISQPRLAALLRVSVASINRWERGLARPSALAWRQFEQVEREGLPSAAHVEDAQSTAPGRAPGNLPVASVRLVGRRRELAEISALLAGADSCAGALLTVTGAGGCGKTRLALAAAAEQHDAFPDGAWFVPLDSLTDPSLVPQTVATALGVRVSAERTPSAALVDALAARRALLVLDNCEHLLDASAALVQRLHEACPSLSVLATSREPLALPGEQVYPLAPLPLPEPEADGLDAALASDAVELFAERARLVRPGFQVTSANVAAVVRICRRLDGLPLAVELAAARVGLLAVEQIADRLDDRFRLLVRPDRGAIPRHQTLRAALDWSYELLEPQEQACFVRLAVFAGRFDLEAAEAVCPGGGIAAAEVLDLLARLIEKSLVVAELDAEQPAATYRLLETLRAYARERLSASGEAEVWQLTHARYALRLAEESATAVTGPEQERWLARLEAEHDDLRAALGWFITREAAEEAQRMAASLWRFWYLRGHVAEGRRWLEATLALPGRVPRDVRAAALNAAGWLAKEQRDFAAARDRIEESIEIRRELGDLSGAASALSNLGSIAYEDADYATARERYQESLAIYRTLDDRRNVAILLNNIAQTVPADEQATVAALYEESLAICRAIGDKNGMVPPLNNLGLAAYARGAYAAARTYYEEALAVSRDLGYRYGVALLLANLGHVAQRQGFGAEARLLHGESLALALVLGHTAATVHAIRSLAYLDAEAGELLTAARLLGAADALAGSAGVPVPPAYAEDHARAEQAIERGVTPELLRAARTVGAALSAEQAVALARERAAVGVATAAPATAGETDNVLTERERTVLSLIVAGRSNKEIARALGLSVRTVERHISNLYAKIGARGKADAITFALRDQQPGH